MPWISSRPWGVPGTALLDWRRGVRRIAWVTFFLFFLYPSCFTALRAEEEPDREMLRLMELLQEWEIINNLDMMRQLETVERIEETSAERGYQESPPEEKEKQK